MIDENVKMNYTMTLYRGKSILFNNICIRQLKLSEIEEIGLSNFLGIVNLSTLTNKSISRSLGIEELKDMDLFDIYMKIEPLKNTLREFLGMFILNEYITFDDLNHEICIYNGKLVGKLNKINFQDFLEVFRFVYCLERQTLKDSERDDIPEHIRKILKKQEAEKEKLSKVNGNFITMNSIIMALCCKHPSLNHFNIWESTLFQIKKELKIIYHQDNCDHIHIGLYAGTVDKEKFKFEEYDWAKEIQ